MTSTTFFIIFIPILAILLLAIYLILAPYNSYQEKNGKLFTPHVAYKSKLPNFSGICLESNILHAIISHISIIVRRDIKKLIVRYMVNMALSKCNHYRIYTVLQTVRVEFYKLCTFYINTTDLFFSIIVFIVKIRYPLVYNIYYILKNEYICVIKGELQVRHINFFVVLGFFIHNVDYFY
jgi:hypothetical protein